MSIEIEDVKRQLAKGNGKTLIPHIYITAKQANQIIVQLKQLEEKNTNLRKALKDCISYIDIDNLTMQAKIKEWEKELNK